MTITFNVLKENMMISPTTHQGLKTHSRVFDKMARVLDPDVAEKLDNKIVAAIMAAPITKDGMFAHLELSQDELKTLLQVHILRQTGGTFSFN